MGSNKNKIDIYLILSILTQKSNDQTDQTLDHKLIDSILEELEKIEKDKKRNMNINLQDKLREMGIEREKRMGLGERNKRKKIGLR